MIRFELGFGLFVMAMWVFCLVDVIGSSEGEIRNLPKVPWLLIVLFFPLAGSVAWLVAGRPQGAARSKYERAAPDYPEYDRPGRASATSPEDDEEFLRKVRERAEEQRRAYRAAQLEEQKQRHREDQERQQRKQQDGPETGP